MTFQDRTGTNLNRKKIKIISQTGSEMIVDIERADEATNEGTPINASVFNKFNEEILENTAKSEEAVQKATNAETNSATAILLANNANSENSQLSQRLTVVEGKIPTFELKDNDTTLEITL